VTFGSWNIVFYECLPRQSQCRGNVPVEKFICKFPKTLQAYIAKKLDMYATMAPDLKEPHVKQVRGKIWEFRIEPKGIPLRILYFIPQKGTIVLLHGFKKTSRMTPNREIKAAESRMLDYRKRYLQE